MQAATIRLNRLSVDVDVCVYVDMYSKKMRTEVDGGTLMMPLTCSFTLSEMTKSKYGCQAKQAFNRLL